MRCSYLFLAVILAMGTAAQGDTQTWVDSVPIQPTNFSSSVTIPQFDPSLGSLLSILFTLDGTVQGEAGFESRDAAPATVTMNLQASITLHRPDMSSLVVVLPLVQTVDNVTAFDGVIDFGGTSGRTYTGLSNSASMSATSPPPASDLVLFTGTGNITLPVTGVGASSGSGAGNLILQFNTSGGADITVVYTYEIPEPSTLTLLSLGGIGLLRRRRTC